MAYERSESTGNNSSEFIHQFQPEIKTLIRKLKRVLVKLCRQNVSLLFNQTCFNERLLPNTTHTHKHTYLYLYLYIYIYIAFIKHQIKINQIEIRLLLFQRDLFCYTQIKNIKISVLAIMNTFFLIVVPNLNF